MSFEAVLDEFVEPLRIVGLEVFRGDTVVLKGLVLFRFQPLVFGVVIDVPFRNLSVVGL